MAKIAIVLSGGGSKGDFEIGVIKYLYTVENIRPMVLCGTSVGAINAAKLAEGEGTQFQGLPDLIAIWEGLKTEKDMFLEEPWLNSIDPRMKALFTQKATTQMLNSLNPPDHFQTSWPGILALPDMVDYAGRWIGWAKDDAPAILDGIGKLMAARSLYNLDPIYQLLTSRLHENLIHQWAQQVDGRALRLAVVGLNTGALRYITEFGGVIERDQSPAYGTTFTPGCDQIAEDIDALQDSLHGHVDDVLDDIGRAPYHKPTPPTVATIGSIAAEIKRKKQELADCLANARPVPVPVPTTTVAQGVLASASQPFIFPVVTIADETYVDAGIRELTPIQAAIDLRCDEIYAVVTSNPYKDIGEGSPPDPYTYKTPAVSVLLRSLPDIALDEVERDELKPPGGFASSKPTNPNDPISYFRPNKVTIIIPNMYIHDGFVVDPGLITISMDHGFMRAADVLHPSSDPDQQTQREELATKITQNRVDTWALECTVHGQPIPGRELVSPDHGDSPDLYEIRRLKKSLVDLIVQRRGTFNEKVDGIRDTPDFLAAALDAWERHRFPPLTQSPWREFVFPKTGETVPGDTPPKLP